MTQFPHLSKRYIKEPELTVRILKDSKPTRMPKAKSWTIQVSARVWRTWYAAGGGDRRCWSHYGKTVWKVLRKLSMETR